VFKNLERLSLSNPDPFVHLTSRNNAIADLRIILEFAGRTGKIHPWRSSVASNLLLKICTQFNLKKKGLTVLQLIGKNGCIQTDEIAESIAEFECRVAGNLINY